MILCIDTSDSQKTVVGLKTKDGKSLGRLIEERKYGSQVILPQITKILKKNKKKLSDLTAIEVNVGPGSYTGLRVGLAVANALAWALKLPINGKKKGELVYPIYEK